MVVTVRSLDVAVPKTPLLQTELRDVMMAQPGLSRLGSRVVSTAFNDSGIERRYTVMPEWGATEPVENPVFFDPATRQLLSPSTGTRNRVYAEEVVDLYVRAARGALDTCEGLDHSDVTHVITASCTGFFAPGPDYKLVRELDLAPSVQRYHLGFMGCYAAFPALRQAKTICDADPQAVVLVVCAELCTLHAKPSTNQDTLLASSLFGDGAGAAVITGRDMDTHQPAMQLDHFETVLTPVGEESMAWNIGDNGFDMVLGTYVPHIIDGHIVEALAPLLARDPSLAEREYAEIEHWAIHPGGRSILDKVQAKLGLGKDQLNPSREVLHDYGNMSSATVLFVLKRILEDPSARAGDRVCGMAFGPGLTVETGLMTLVGGVGAERPGQDTSA